MVMSCSSGNASPNLPSAGSRVIDSNGFRATVRYVGPVCTAKDRTSIWVGVEFDDPTRGKHDGVVDKPDGTKMRYFDCEDGSGSFLKPEKLSTGLSMAEALRKQYVGMNAPLVAPQNVLPDAYACTLRGGRKAIEFYGEVKVRHRQQTHALDRCTLREAGISRAGDLDALREAAGAFVEVDIKANLISDWHEVGLIASQIPTLEVLSLGSNRMSQSTEAIYPPLSSGACSTLRVLEISSCGIKSWSQVEMLGKWAPHLEELCAADNDMSDILTVTETSSNKMVPGFEHLKTLDLSEARLTSWDQVMCLSSMPRLCTLLLNHNSISTVNIMTPLVESSGSCEDLSQGARSSAVERDMVVEDRANSPTSQSTASESSASPPESGGGTQRVSSSASFSTLKTLSLAGNKVFDWSSVDQLASLQALRALRFTGNPVTSGLGASEARALCIARLPGLQRVNGSDCGRRERRDAEKLYLRGILCELAEMQRAPSNGGKGMSKTVAEAAISERHPRYQELLQAHGELTGFGPAGALNAETSTLASSMAQVTLISLAAASCTMEPAKKRLPVTMSIGKLKLLCKRLYKVEVDQQVLSLRPEPGALLSRLDNDEKSLSYYGVSNCCEILIDEADETKRSGERDRAHREEADRMAEQLRHTENLDTLKHRQVAADLVGAQLAAGT